MLQYKFTTSIINEKDWIEWPSCGIRHNFGVVTIVFGKFMCCLIVPNNGIIDISVGFDSLFAPNSTFGRCVMVHNDCII